MVEGFINSLKVAVTTALGQMPVAPLAGVSEITSGMQGLVAVVKLQT
jgi:hypothetical protein